METSPRRESGKSETSESTLSLSSSGKSRSGSILGRPTPRRSRRRSSVRSSFIVGGGGPSGSPGRPSLLPGRNSLRTGRFIARRPSVHQDMVYSSEDGISRKATSSIKRQFYGLQMDNEKVDRWAEFRQEWQAPFINFCIFFFYYFIGGVFYGQSSIVCISRLQL